MDITYEKIKTIIQSETVDGQMVNISFYADGLTEPIKTMGYIMPDQDEIIKNAMKQAAMAAGTSAAISGAAGLLGGAIGGEAGYLAKSVVSSAGQEAAAGMRATPDYTKTDVTREKIEAAVVQAFMGVQMYFQYNESTNSWTGVMPG